MSASVGSINENDFESPGYEYLRSYQNMSNLYYKLISLNYYKEFCPQYKCPPIHRYYFSIASKNVAEQRFLFACLSSWLIKDKCQMNLELEPEEYEDPDVVIGVIYEALRLLVSPEEELGGSNRELKNLISFAPGRLKQGFGPEVIWTLNILADRDLEIMLESNSSDTIKMKIVYVNKSSLLSEPNKSQPGTVANSITIGQPFVGGGLTTRPLGSYQIDDRSLLFDDDAINDSANDMITNTENFSEEIEPEEWYRQVARSVQALESAQMVDDINSHEDWQEYIKSVEESKKSIDEFLYTSKPVLDAITNRIDRHLQILNGREKFIQTNLKSQIDEFLKDWRNYSKELNQHDALLKLVNDKTDKFESYNCKLKEINEQIETRIKDLNDGRKLEDLEVLIGQLKREDADFKLKIGLLLTVYSKLQAEIVAANLAQQL